MSGGLKDAFDLRIPFFRPVWRRVLFVAVLFGWAVVEIVSGSPWWALLVGGIGLYAAYVFLLASGPEDFEKKDPD